MHIILDEKFVIRMEAAGVHTGGSAANTGLALKLPGNDDEGELRNDRTGKNESRLYLA